MNKIYSKDRYNIYKYKGTFILHNILKDWKNGHTHLQTYAECKYILNLSKNKKLPKSISKYLLISLKRISDDQQYIERIDAVLNKKDSYSKKEVIE